MNAAEIERRTDADVITAQLDADSYAVIPGLLDDATCRGLVASYHDPASRFRSVVNMARHNFGQGEYRYFDYPLPPIVSALRAGLYPALAATANHWHRQLRINEMWPTTHAALLQRCHAAGQTRPTPLLLRYTAGDYNCLHQDLYGDVYFPLQAVALLSTPQNDFAGGELILVEQRPRMQSRATVVPIARGDIVVFPVRERPRAGKRGYHRTTIRHGVSRLHRGERVTLGIIFHDAG